MDNPVKPGKRINCRQTLLTPHLVRGPTLRFLLSKSEMASEDLQT